MNEREVADTLISEDERAVYADGAYESTASRARLRAPGITDRIKHRSPPHQRGLPLAAAAQCPDRAARLQALAGG